VKDLFQTHLEGEKIIIKSIFAVYQRNLLSAFISYIENQQQRLSTNPHIFQNQNWQKDDSDGQKQWIKDSFDKRVTSFSWNDDRIIKIIPQVHGTNFDTALSICETGFASLGIVDKGWYGKGIYFTSSAVYAAPYFGTKKKPAIIIAYIVPGNPYPVSEHPFNNKSLIGSAMQDGVQSHYVITSINGYPVLKPCEKYYDELIITQEAQALPAFIIEVDPSNIPNLFMNRQVVTPNAQGYTQEITVPGIVEGHPHYHLVE